MPPGLRYRATMTVLSLHAARPESPLRPRRSPRARMRIVLLPAALLLAALLTGGCGPKATLTAERPAPLFVPGLETVAVGDFSGDYGVRVRDCFRTRLHEARRLKVEDARAPDTPSAPADAATPMPPQSGDATTDDTPNVPSLEARPDHDDVSPNVPTVPSSPSEPPEAFQKDEAAPPPAPQIISPDATAESAPDAAPSASGAADASETAASDASSPGDEPTVVAQGAVTVKKRILHYPDSRPLRHDEFRTLITERKLRVTARLDLFAPDGRSLGSHGVSRERNERFSDDDPWWGDGYTGYFTTVPSTSSVLRKMACDCGRELADSLSPQTYTLEVPLDDHGGPVLKEGVHAAEAGNWPRAVALWRHVLGQPAPEAATEGETMAPAAAVPPAVPVSASERAAALHNLGVALEAQGTVASLLEARDRYNQALVLAHRSITAEALDRIEQRLVEARAVRHQRVRE